MLIQSKFKFSTSASLLCVLTAMYGCGGGGSTTPVPTPGTPPPGACYDQAMAREFGISAVPQALGTVYQNKFCKYTAIIAPNGKSIGIFAEKDISDEQMLRARNILEFYLENVSGTEYGADKSAVANAMANNGAKLLLLNGSDDGSNDVTMEGQPLYDSELIVEGTPAYINNDYENHRDAAFEEILHLMHDYGIGTSGQGAAPGAQPAYMAEIDNARANAMTEQLWPTANIDSGTASWIEELRQEGSLSQEYLASVIDSYYGYWGAHTESEGGMWGIYAAKTRSDIEQKDPMGYAIVQKYFNPVVTYMARIDSGFQGDFSLAFDEAKPYTHKSQYLVNATLTGTNDANLIGNSHDNQLAGNAGTNRLDGMGGNDTAIFKGEYAEYSVSFSGDQIIVQDSVDNRNGLNTLNNIEYLAFNTKLYKVANGELVEL